MMLEITVRVPSGSEQLAVVGAAERNLKMIREALGVTVGSRDGIIRVSGARGRVAVARAVLERLGRAAKDRQPLDRSRVLELIAEEAARAQPILEAEDQLEHRRDVEVAPAFADAPWPNPSHHPNPNHPPGRASPPPPPHAPPQAHDLIGPAWDGDMHVYAAGRPIRPKTDNQRLYIDAIRRHDLVFGVGPAGTGKTYLAVAAAVHLLRIGRVQRVVLARPAVEAGERLGFLPGDLQDKVNPYLRPLIDALHDMLDYPTIRRFMDNDVIEISPLAFMRGRTLNNSVIILDEAQNTTRGQMKMFLTRLGHGSRAIVTGDTTQIDLPNPAENGLTDAARRLARVRGVSFVQLTGGDVVRHDLVRRIVDAYGDEPQAAPEYADQLRRALNAAEHPPGDTPLIDSTSDSTP